MTPGADEIVAADPNGGPAQLREDPQARGSRTKAHAPCPDDMTLT
jgi:hypothetical protein